MLSVVIPFKNGLNLLEKSVNSICSNVKFNLEIIIVLNNSKYSLKNVRDKLERFSTSLKIFELSNGGANMARYFGVKKSTHNNILFSDSDDIYLPGSINFLHNGRCAI